MRGLSSDRLKSLLAAVAVMALTTTACTADPTTEGGDPQTGGLPGCEGQAVNNNTPNTRTPGLVTADHQLYPLECAEQALAKTLEDAGKPFVLFVHGRGAHPAKEQLEENDLLPRIEKQYGVTAIMFTWPSHCGSDCFPKENARDAADELAHVLTTLKSMKTRESGERPYVLLTHSMGGIVLSALPFAVDGDGRLANLFDNVVVSAPAAPHDGHRNWVDNLDIGGRIYITANEKDRTLSCVEGQGNNFFAALYCKWWLGFDEPPRLGRWAVQKATTENTSTKATYLGFTSKELGDTHRYYVNQSEPVPRVFAFYQAALTGETPPLDGFEEVILGRVYKIPD